MTTTTTPAPDEGAKLLTIPQVAERLQISKRKVYRLISQGIICARRIGDRNTRVLENELIRLIGGLPDVRDKRCDRGRPDDPTAQK